MKNNSKFKRIAAIIIVIILVAMYLVTLLLAIFSSDNAGHMFQASLFLTIALPILLWIYIFLYGIYAKKHTIADLDLFESMKKDAENSPSDPNAVKDYTDNSDSL